jgi:hypothetical protein
VIDDRQENDYDTLTKSEDIGGNPSVYTDRDDSTEGSPLSDDMQTMFLVREATDEHLTKAHEVDLNEHSFHQIRSIFSLTVHVKSASKINAGEVDEPIKTFLRELTDLPSCYNKRNGYCVQCTCTKKIADLDRAVDYIPKVATMTKKEQDALFIDLIN